MTFCVGVGACVCVCVCVGVWVWDVWLCVCVGDVCAWAGGVRVCVGGGEEGI